MNGRLVYKPQPWGRVTQAAGMALLAIPFVFLSVAILWGAISPAEVQPEGTLPRSASFLIAAVLLFAVTWNAYWHLYRLSISTSFDGEVLVWTTCFATGSMHISEVAGVRTGLFGMSVEIRGLNGRISMLARKGITEFVDDITSVRPELAPRTLGLYAAMSERLPGPDRLYFEPA